MGIREEFPAPRDFPLEYPGKRPTHHYLLVGDSLAPILIGKHRSLAEASVNGSALDDLLDTAGATPLRERFAVVGYGSNPVPGQLLSKFGDDAIVPVIHGSTDGQIVYNLISAQGYAFCELIPAAYSSAVTVTLLDRQQLDVMLATEPNYDLAKTREIRLENGESFPGVFFVGRRPIWVPASYDAPVITAELNPRQGALTQRETLQLVIDEFGLSDRGITTPEQLAHVVRAQRALPERPGILKYDLQQCVAQDPRSCRPAAESAELVRPDQCVPYAQS